MRYLSSCLCPAALGLELQSKAGDSDLTLHTTYTLHLPPADASQPPPGKNKQALYKLHCKKTTGKPKGAFTPRLWGG